MPPHYTNSRKPGRLGSLASALEEERLELAGELESRNAAYRRNQNTPARSSLETAPSPGVLPPRHGSIAGIGVGVTPPSHNNNNRRSEHEPAVSASPSSPSKTTATATTAPAPTTTSVAPPPTVEKPKYSGKSAPRRFSDQSASDIEKLKNSDNNSNNSNHKPRPSIRWDDSVVMPPSATIYGAPRRPSQTQEKPSNKGLQGKNAMAAVMSGLDLRVGLPSFTRGRDSGRNNATRGTSLDSRFPSSRFGRSSSPKNRWRSPNSRNPSNPPNPPVTLTRPATAEKATADKVTPEKVAPEKVTPDKVTLDKDTPDKDTIKKVTAEKVTAEKTPDMETADKPQPKPAPPEPSDSDGKPPTPGDERLEKDMYDSENNLIDTSDEEPDSSSSSDDEPDSSIAVETVERGRKQTVDRSTAPEPRRRTTSKTGPPPLPKDSTDSTNSLKQGQTSKASDVHPRTSFDTASATNTPFGSEDEAELSDIKRAQQLGIQMSTIDNTVHNRSIRTIIRGDYTNLSEETEGGRRRSRKYLVTTDLSEESVYALEWTIGTILRDGDTMYAVCAMHEEMNAPNSVQIGEGAKAMQDSAAVVGSQTEETARKSQNDSSTNLSRAILGRLGTDSKPSSVDGRGMSKTESERVRAVETVSQTCVRLLRKTLLQVRVAVEVIHCKSPKHMITEAIDGLDPTLVIVGARGRSALKGVLLGSFSNYLVMHSSVPVMVARRKLKKQSKNKKTYIRLSNNLLTPKKLALAKVD